MSRIDKLPDWLSTRTDWLSKQTPAWWSTRSHWLSKKTPAWWPKHAQAQAHDPAIFAAAILGLIGALVVLALVWRRTHDEEEDPNGSKYKDLRIKSLFIHPIKSCRFIELTESEYDLTGLRYDRNWMIINADTHKFNTARDLPQMVLIEPSLHPETNELRVRIPYSAERSNTQYVDISTPLDPSQEFLDKCEVVRDIHIWGHKNQDGYAVSAEADEALTRFFGREVRLVRKGPTPRDVIGKDGDPEGVFERVGSSVKPAPQALESRAVRFQDFLPFLIVTDASMEFLRQSLLRSLFPPLNPDADDQAKAQKLSSGPFEVRSWSLPLDKIDTSTWTPEYVHKLPINRYRPNVLLTSADGADGDGTLVGFEEDNWTHLEVFPSSSSEPAPFGKEAEGKGKGIFCLARCGRCTVPGVDIETGVRDGILPARVLQRFRMVDQNQPYSPCFGILSSPRETSGVLRVGDTVRVTRTGIRPIFKKPSTQ